MQVDPTIEARVAARAGRQWGAISHRQLRRLGMSSSAIGRWLKRGLLHPVHRGVYLFGHAVSTPFAAESAALLACGDDSALGDRTASVLWDLLEPDDGPIHVITRRHRGRPRGLKVHTTTRLDRKDTTYRHGLRVTTVPRTLLDLAEGDERELERAVETAFAKRKTTERQLRALIARSPGRRGAATLTALLDYRGDSGYTRSKAEDLMRRIARAAGLPQPVANAWVLGCEVDFLWRAYRLIVEIDSWGHHASRRAFENDRARDANLEANDYRVIRFTWRQLTERPEQITAQLAAALALASR